MSERDEDELYAADATILTLRAEVEALRRLCADMISRFTEKGHPGRPCLRTSWINEETVAQWHRTYRENS